MLDQNGMGAQLIHELAEQGDVQGLQQLLESDPNLINANGCFGMKPLHYAARGGSVDCIQLLINKGAKVNAKCVYQTTAIFETTTAEIAKILIENGATLNLVSERGRTPLDMAVQSLQVDVVRYLVNHGADVNYWEKLDFFRTMTQWALVEIGNKDQGKIKAYQVLEILLKAGANPNLKNLFDKTVLHEASRCGLTRIVELLLNYEADPCLRDANQNSCFDYANNYPEILELFEPYRQNLKPVIKKQDTPEQLITRLRKIPKFKDCEFKPCTEAEIEDLEKRNGVKLPEAYKKFLRIMGHGAGSFLEDDHWYIFYEDFEGDDWMSLGVKYFKIPEEEYDDCCQEEIDWSIDFPSNFFVFAHRGGDYSLGFFGNEVSEDPPIYTVEGSFTVKDYENQIKRVHGSFWEFFQGMIEYYEFYADPNRFSSNQPEPETQPEAEIELEPEPESQPVSFIKCLINFFRRLI